MKYCYIGNNCMGGLIYQHFNEQYNDPFIWSLILDDMDFVHLCKDLDKYMEKDIIKGSINESSRWCKDTNKKTFNDWEYPIVDLSGINIHWIHHTNKEEQLFTSYKRRVERFKVLNDKKIIFLFNTFTLFHQHTIEEFEELLRIFLENKHRSICLLADDLPERIYQMFINTKDIMIKMNGMKYNESNRNAWNYNLQDTPDKRYTFISLIEKIKNNNL